MRKWNLANNLLYLREAHGDTQNGLAESIGVSKSTISKYGNPKKCDPDPEILQRIATRYGVTVDELCYGDFSYLQGVKLNEFPISDFSKNKEVSSVIFPVFKPSKKAFEDPFFVKGYEAQNRIIKYFYGNEIEFNSAILNLCVDSYAESISKNGTLESSANLLWLFVFASSIVKTKKLYYGLQQLYMGQLDEADFYKKYVYKSFAPNEKNEIEPYVLGEAIEFDCKELKVLEELCEITEDDYATLFHNLKIQYKGCEYADYYMALRYIYDMVDNDCDEATNQLIGRELMGQFYMMGNKYASKYYEMLSEYYLDE